MPTATSSRKKTVPRRQRILSYLSSQGGRVDSVDGRGLTLKMATKVGYDNIAALNAILARLERDGEIVRDVRGKRTYSIALKGRATRLSRANGQAKTASRPQVRRPADVASGRGRRRGQARRSSGAGVGRSPGSNLPQLFAALGNELLALRQQNEEMSRRLDALEVAAKPASRRANGRRAA
jgi:hypothetical protein